MCDDGWRRFGRAPESSCVLVRRLRSPEIDSLRAESCGAGFLRRAVEHVLSPRDLEAREAAGLYELLQLCLQQSTGDSTGP